MATQQTPQTLPAGQRFVQANMVVRARHLTDDDRKRFNIPPTAAADTIGIFHPSTGELINTMGADQFQAYYHELDLPTAQAAGQGATQPANQTAQPAAQTGGQPAAQAGTAAQPANQGAAQPAGQGHNAAQSAQDAPGGPNAAAGSRQG